MTAETDTPDRSQAAESAPGAGRDRKGRFGRGNPGKPKGSRNRATQAAELMLSADLQRLTKKCIAMALEGDSAAMRLVLERLLPARRPIGEHVTLPELSSASTPSARAAAILDAAASGKLAVDTAKALVEAVACAMKVSEIDDLARRIEALEQSAPKGKRP